MFVNINLQKDLFLKYQTIHGDIYIKFAWMPINRA